jgi:hypothetical protein
MLSCFDFFCLHVRQFELAQHEMIQVPDCDDLAALIIRKIDIKGLLGTQDDLYSV